MCDYSKQRIDYEYKRAKHTQDGTATRKGRDGHVPETLEITREGRLCLQRKGRSWPCLP